MPIPTECFAAGLPLPTLSLGGCGVYQKHDYDRVVESKLDPAEQTPTALIYPVPCQGLDWQ